MNAIKKKPTIWDNIWCSVKSKFIEIIILGVIGAIVLLFNAWTAVPTEVKTLEQNQIKNEAEHQIFYKKFDSINKNMVNKSDYKSDMQEMKQTLQRLDDRMYDIWIKQK